MIKKLIRDWLGGPYTNQEALETLVSRAEMRTKNIPDLYERLALHMRLITQVEQKMDALCGALGVDIVGNTMIDSPPPFVVSVHEDGLLGKANIQFFDAIKAQRQALIAQLQALSDADQ